MQNSISSYEMDGMDVVITNKGLLESNVIVGTALLCGFLVEALNMLKRLPLQNIVSWTALISGHVDNGWVFYLEEACIVFSKQHNRDLVS